MSVSRRRFLKSAAVVSAAAIMLKPAAVFALGQKFQPFESVSLGSDRLYRRDMFKPYVGDVFRVRVGKQMVDLKLVALEDVAPGNRRITSGKVARTDCFSLRFHASTPLPGAARIHNLSHGKLGRFNLFMSPSQQDGRFMQTAIINHFA
jgi:hypothetical protein